MLQCEGYKMFYGVMEIKPKNTCSHTVEGTWLYKPEYECWYCKGRSYPVDVCFIIKDTTKTHAI